MKIDYDSVFRFTVSPIVNAAASPMELGAPVVDVRVSAVKNGDKFQFLRKAWSLRVYHHPSALSRPVFYLIPEVAMGALKVFDPEGNEVPFSHVKGTDNTPSLGAGLRRPISGRKLALCSFRIDQGLYTIVRGEEAFQASLALMVDLPSVSPSGSGKASDQLPEEKLSELLFNLWLKTISPDRMRRSYNVGSVVKKVDLDKVPFRDLPKSFQEAHVNKAKIALRVKAETSDEATYREALAAALYADFMKATKSKSAIDENNLEIFSRLPKAQKKHSYEQADVIIGLLKTIF